MATLGRWTGGSKTQGNLPETWTAPTSLFDTQQRNDGSAYSWAAATSILTLPSSNLADGYLVIGAFKYVDTSNGRFNPQGRFVLNSGTGTFVSAYTGGYNRDNSEDTSYVRTWAFIDGPSASATIQFQWKADTDDATGGTSWSCLEVIPLYYSDVGIYSSTDHSQYGGTTPNQIIGLSGTDGTNITLASNTVTVAGDNKRYLCLGSYFFEGRGGRTQRWGGFRIDGTKDDSAKAYSYYRNTSNDESGEFFTTLIETVTANRTVDLFCYRGDGVTAGQGGADIDGTDPGVGQHALVVIELNDSAEVFHSVDGTGGVDLNVTGPVDQVLCRTTDIDFNDSDSWTRASDNAMNAVVAMDALLGADISAAQEVVSTTSRWTASARFTVNGTEDVDTEAGDYARNNQGSTDTFGWSANLMSFVALSLGDDVGASVQELAGGEDGGRYEVQAGWSGFWGINLDTLEAGGTDVTANVNKQALSLTQRAVTVTTEQNVTATVSKQALTVGQKTATATGEQSVTATINKLSLSLNQSGVTVGTGTTVSVNSQGLSITEYGTTVSTTSNVSVSVNKQALSLTQHSATAITDQSVTANVSKQSLSLTGHSASVVTESNVTANINALSLSVAQRSVTVSTSGNVTATISKQSLSVTQRAVSVSADSSVTASISKQALSITQYSASVGSGTTAIINKQSLSLTQHSPGVNTGVTAAANKQTLSISQKGVSVSVGVQASVLKQALSLTQYSAVVDTAGNTTVNISKQSLLITGRSVSVQADSSVTVNVNKQSLSVNQHSVGVSIPKTVSVNGQSLSATQYATTVSTTANATPGVNKQALSIVQYGASVVSDANVLVSLSKQSLSLSQYSLSIKTDNVVLAAPIEKRVLLESPICKTETLISPITKTVVLKSEISKTVMP